MGRCSFLIINSLFTSLGISFHFPLTARPATTAHASEAMVPISRQGVDRTSVFQSCPIKTSHNQNLLLAGRCWEEEEEEEEEEVCV